MADTPETFAAELKRAKPPSRDKTEWVLLVIDRGLTRSTYLPLRDVVLVRREDGAQETMLHHRDMVAGVAEEIATFFLNLGVPVEDLDHPLPGLEKPDESPPARRPKRRPQSARTT